MTFWSILCAADRRPGHASESIYGTCLKHYGHRKRLPTPMTIPHANGGKGARKKQKEKIDRCWLSAPTEKSPPILAAEPLRAGRKCSRGFFCPFAIGETALYDGSGFLACGRKRLPPLVRVAVVPTISPCRDSTGFDRRACV